MTGVVRRRPRTGQPGTRRRSVNTIPPLVDERSEPRHHNQMESDNNTGQVATVRGRQAGGARDKDSNKPALSTPFVAVNGQASLCKIPWSWRFKESDNNNDRTQSKPVRKNGSIRWVRTQQEEARLQQHHVVWLVEQKKQRI